MVMLAMRTASTIRNKQAMLQATPAHQGWRGTQTATMINRIASEEILITVSNARTARSQSSIDSCRAGDPWTHGAALSHWNHQYERVRPGRFSGHVCTAWFGPVQLVHERIDHAFNYRGTPWQGSRVYFSYLPGCGDVFYDNRPVGVSDLITHRWDAVERVNSSDRINLVIAAIDEQFLREYLMPIPGMSEQALAPNPLCFKSDSAAVAAFQQVVWSILQELTDTPALLGDERLRAGFQQLVLDTIVSVTAGMTGIGGRLPAPSTRAYIVGRAIDFMKARLADPISIRDICTATRVCPRTLSYAFADVLGASPKSYLMATRLGRTHRELADERINASIESIAARWGFSHMGRFARYYRIAFGERPSDTYRARTLRTPASATERPIADTLKRLSGAAAV